jgi:hypothetical protein
MHRFHGITPQRSDGRFNTRSHHVSSERRHGYGRKHPPSAAVNTSLTDVSGPGPSGAGWLVQATLPLAAPCGSRMIKVLLVDDQELVRAGLRAILRCPFGFEIVGDCADGTVVTGMVDALAPDAVLMDVRMPLVDGIVAPGGSERMRMPRRCWRSPSSTTRKCWPACSGPSLRLRAQGRTRRGPASAPFALSPGVTPGSTRLSQAAAWQLTDRRPHPRPDRTPRSAA